MCWTLPAFKQDFVYRVAFDVWLPFLVCQVACERLESAQRFSFTTLLNRRLFGLPCYELDLLFDNVALDVWLQNAFKCLASRR